MSEWIDVPIYCNTNKSSQLKDLGIDIADNDYEIRIGSIRKVSVTGFYPNSNETTTI